MSYKTCVEEAIRLAELAEKNFGLKPHSVNNYNKETDTLSCFATTKMIGGLYLAIISPDIGISEAWETYPCITEPTLTLEEALQEATEQQCQNQTQNPSA